MLEPANTVSILQKQAEPKSFSADEVIFKEGDPANYMYGILDGELTLPRLEARGILRSSKVIQNASTDWHILSDNWHDN